ncbi:aromatic amino acid lyase [Corynebacterium provencense]|uniref:aromatic amino acid lyase n=1 Tax=Corynebacterium provencense TaxID=1737425 RepID=UPI00082DC035|nr:aromatic amino acid lyase [Corynebacterium provencense]MCI1257033.1 aromatic amino acid lyase [Corynebacterium provencense]
MPFELGDQLTPDSLWRIAVEQDTVSVPDKVLDRIGRLHHRLESRDTSQPVYGRTTGVGGNKSTRLEGEGHGMRLLRSHGLETGEPLDRPVVRGMIAVRASQLSHPGSGVPPELLQRLVGLLDADELPTVLSRSAIGTGDLSALAGLGLALAGERPCTPEMHQAPFRFSSDNALPFISSSALTVSRAVLSLVRLEKLTDAAAAVFALTASAVAANPQHWSAASARAAAAPGVPEVADLLRRLTDSPAFHGPVPRVQERYGFRTFITVLGALVARTAALRDHLTALMNIAQENPLFVEAEDGTVDAVHHGNFNQIELAQELDAVNLALACTCPLTESRIADAMDPGITGLPPFVAQGPEGSSGLMILEYVSSSAGAEMRASAAPVSLGTTTVSRGMEEDASFAPQAVDQLNRSLDAFEVQLACELFAAVRVLRLRGRAGLLSPVLREIWSGASTFDTTDEDHDLRPGFRRTLDFVPGIADILRSSPGHGLTAGRGVRAKYGAARSTRSC